MLRAMEAGAPAQPPKVESTRPSRRVLALSAIAVLAVVAGSILAAVVLNQRKAPNVASSSTSPSLAATTGANPSGVAPTPVASEIPYPADAALLQVTVPGLRMREAAGTAAKVQRTFDFGEVVRVVSGPTAADGYDWYQVLDLDTQTGWVAQGGGGQPWLATVPPDPATSPLLLRFERACDAMDLGMTGFPADVTLSADGRLVLRDGIVRKLSPAGFARVRRDVLQMPALQTSAFYRPELRPDVSGGPGHGACTNRFTLGEGAEQVVVNAINWQGNEEESTYYLPAPERRALDELAAHLADVEAWLGAAAWSTPSAQRYVSGSYEFLLSPNTGPLPPSFVDTPTVSGAAWPFPGPIEQFGGTGPDWHCGYLDLGQAFETLRVMRQRGVSMIGGGVDPPPPLTLDTFGSGVFTTDAGWFAFWLTPRSPDGYPACPQ